MNSKTRKKVRLVMWLNFLSLSCPQADILYDNHFLFSSSNQIFQTVLSASVKTVFSQSKIYSKITRLIFDNSAFRELIVIDRFKSIEPCKIKFLRYYSINGRRVLFFKISILLKENLRLVYFSWFWL